MNHLDVRLRNKNCFYLKFDVKKEYESNNLFTKYCLKNARDWHNHLCPSSLLLHMVALN